MESEAAPFPTQPDPPKTEEPDAALISDEDELTDEEDFYLAQEVAFACLRARYEARPRRKL